MLDLFRRSAGPEEAELARYWLERSPECLFVADVGGEVVAAAMNVMVTPGEAGADRDTVVAARPRQLEEDSGAPPR